MKTFLIFIIFLGPLIFFHELGHFLFARFFGVKVEAFSIGFGPKIFSFKRGDTTYSLSAIPLGGYVKMFGDDPLSEEELSEDEKKVAYTHKSKWARFWIVFGGPLANFIMAYFLYAALFISGEKVPEARIGNVPQNTIYYDRGLRSEDLITKVNDMEIVGFDDLSMIDNYVKSITVKRKNVEQVEISIENSKEEFAKNLFTSTRPLREPFVVSSEGKFYALSWDESSDSFSFTNSLESFLESNKTFYLTRYTIHYLSFQG